MGELMTNSILNDPRYEEWWLKHINKHPNLVIARCRVDHNIERCSQCVGFVTCAESFVSQVNEEGGEE